MRQEHKFTFEDKLKWWGYGEWVEEPDEVYFIHEEIECKIIRIACEEPYSKNFHMFGGYLCGYISIPLDNPSFEKDYDDIDMDCHWGLTYSKREKDKWWIGFDCAHSGDITPSMEMLRNTIPELMEIRKKYPVQKLWEDTYKNIQFCIDQCKSMAEQLISYKV